MRPGFFVRLLINAAALWVATRVVPGVTYQGGWLPFLGLALVFGVVNTVVGLFTKILAIPLILLTLGFFLLVINGLMLQLTSAVAGTLGIGFHVDGFWSAFWGALVVSIVSTLLGFMVVDRRPTMVISRDHSRWS
jgi:putative membrane protein